MEQKGNRRLKTFLEILLVSTRLGLTSFGGPIAHLGYFHEEYIRRRQWMDEESYGDLVALCQFLPGPSSSQVGIGVGVIRGGLLGGILSFIGFTLPSVLILILFASFLHTFNFGNAGWIHGLKIVAVAVVAHAVLGMAKTLTPDIRRKSIALLALVSTLLFPTPFTQIIVIFLSGVVGFFIFQHHIAKEKSASSFRFPLSRRSGYLYLGLFLVLMILLPILRETTDSHWVALVDPLYRSGALVFGGGHVLLPLLEQEFIPTGWLSEEQFLAGYGATQAVPGPLFTFAAYIGTATKGWIGGLVATVAIFLPGFLLILGALPFWEALRRNLPIKKALMGVNAAVVGILLSALYHPIWTTSILNTKDFVLAAVLFGMLAFWKFPPWAVVLVGALGGMLISAV